MNQALQILFPAGLLFVAAMLGLLQERDRRRRAERELDEEERAYYAGQEVRRRWGLITLGIVAIVIYVGLTLDPGVRGKPNVSFVVVWAVVVLLTSALLWFAFLDVRANFAHARVRLQSISRERRELFAQLRTARASSSEAKSGREADDDDDHDDDDDDEDDGGPSRFNGHHNGWRH